MRLKSWVAGWVLVASAWAAGAMAGPIPLSRFEHTAFTRRDGAPTEVDGIAQTRDGYLWFGSDRGLFFFDGVRFRQFIPAKGEHLLAISTNRLFARPDGSLVIDYAADRLSILKDGHLTHVDALPGLREAVTSQLAAGKGSDVWLADRRALAVLRGTQSRIVFRFTGGAPLDAFTVDRDSGDVWIARAGRLWVLRAGEGEPVDIAPAPAETFGLALIRPGWLFVRARDKKIWRFRMDGPHLVPLGPVDGFAGDVIPDRYGGIWLPDLGDGVHRLEAPDVPGANEETFGSRDGFSGDYAYRGMEDSEGNVWICTQSGVDRFRVTPFAPLPVPRGAHSLSIMPGQGRDVWIGSENNPLLRWDGRQLLPTPAPRFAMSMFWDGKAAWTATRGELWRMDGEGAVRAGGLDGGLFPIAMARETSGRTWFVVLKGKASVQVLDGGVLAPADLSMKAAAVALAPDGAIWVGGANNALVRIDGQVHRAFGVADGLAIGTVRALAWRDGELWIAGLGGVQVLRQGRFRTLTVAGAVLSDATGIAFDAGGNLWVHGLNGLVRLSPRLLGPLANTPLPGDIRTFDALDGVEGLPSDVRSLPSLKVGGDGRLWVQNLSNAASIDPMHLPAEMLPPPARILSVHSKGSDAVANGAANLGPGMRDLEIMYTSPVLGVPERARFRYRLDGFDDAWQDAASRRAAYYTNLPPGEYTFHVQAGNDAGDWNTRSASFHVSVAPAWYQTGWFALLVVLAVAIVVYTLHRWRVGQVARQWRIRLDERTAVARDLHDTILQGAQGTALQLQAMAGDVADATLRARLVRVAELARETASESRARLDDLRAHGEDDRFPAAALIDLGQRLSRQETIAFVSSVSGTVVEMEGGAGREVRSAIAEMLINAFTHAQGTRVELAIDYGRRFHASVADNGVGMKDAVAAAGQRDGHFGLPGLRERTRRLGGRLSWVRPEGGGTRVSLSVPRRRLYARSTVLAPVVAWLKRWAGALRRP
ncbi:histidine kinase [Luteibacter aegosomaticola]|uniref:sensor histidine kinase n=1 Tax=Luteibacter aegosomaticola TaxID=2911538 RepID=UPI001FFA6137|nr:sensor histidine kinase [Luteibacter aegosomaticola]UPG88124.1 histidine kinase [Luteibacter aegosomaticola]